MFIGLLLAIGCGASWGLCLAPMRVLKQWEWENIWAPFSFVALLIGPILVGYATVPHYNDVNRTVGLRILALTLFIGAISGMSGFLYSMTVPVIGLGLATAVNGGSSMAMSLLPLFVLHRDTVLHKSGLLTLLGVGLAVVGISLCGKGGGLREKELADGTDSLQKKSGLTFMRSVIACCVAGAISSGMNLALSFPNPIFDIAHKFGSNDFGAANAFVTPYLVGGFFSNILYVSHIWRKKGTFSHFRSRGNDFWRLVFWATLMGAIFAFGAYSYAGAVGLLGSFGAVITWGVSMTAMILISSSWDMSLGEWKGRPLRVMGMGVFVLMIAIVALSLAEYFHQLETATHALMPSWISCA